MEVSIVTTCLNASAYIAEAIESAQQQNVSIEHVIADGGSTDGTLAILSRYPHLTIDSRKDSGIYDGINRGVDMSTGDVILLLNADDLLAPDCLTHIIECFAEDRSLDILAGGVSFIDNKGTEVGAPLAPTLAPYAEGLAFGVPAICGRAFSRNFWRRIGPFDLRLPLAADRAWLLRSTARQLRSVAIQRTIYRYRIHAASASLSGAPEARQKLWREHLSMARILLAEESDSGVQGACRKLLALEATKLVVAAVRAAEISEARRVIAEAGKIDPLFFARLPAALMVWVRRRGRHSDT